MLVYTYSVGIIAKIIFWHEVEQLLKVGNNYEFHICHPYCKTV